MKKTLSLLFVLLIVSNCFYFASFAEENLTSASDNMDFAVKTAEIIKNDSDESSMLRIIGKLHPETSDFNFPYIADCVISEDGRFVLQFSSEKELLSCLEKLNKNPDIVYAERDCEIYTAAVEETGEYLSWGVEAIEADVYSKFLAPLTSDKTVTVAIIDSGSEDIDFIKDKLVQGYDFFENDNDAFQDESIDSHGTFLASIVADCTRDIPVKIMPVRVLDSKTGSLINIINGIIYAVDNGADVINISLGAVLNNCKSLEDAINYAEEKNVSVVVCAGNAKMDIKNYCPAHIENAITVSSINSEYEFSESFSNFGDKIDISAPGVNIKGYNASGEITVLSGTSMSAAYVSAAAAMYRLDNTGCNTKQVSDALISCAKDYGDSGWDKYYGHGVLKLGNIKKSTSIPVESVAFPQSSYTLSVGDTVEIEPVFSPADATDKSFILSAGNGNISINGNIITAVSDGVSILTVTSNDGNYSDTAEIVISKTAPEIVPPEIIAKLKIKNNPGTKTINYGETLRLTAEISDRPENSMVWWYVDGVKISEGEVFETAALTGNINITAKLVDVDGLPVINSQGIEVSDTENVTVKSGFLQKLISFFKYLFRLNRTVVQFIFKD